MPSRPAEAYAIRYYLKARSGSTSNAHFDAQLANGGAPVTLPGSTVDNPDVLAFTAYNFTFVAATTSATLTLNYRNDLQFWYIDDVSVAPVAPPAVTKAFSADQIPLNGSTTLTFNLANPNATTTLTGVAFTDTLPAGLVVATPNGLAGSCGGGTITAVAGSSTVSLAGASLAAGASCAFSVDVTGTTAGVKNNSVTVTSAEGGTSSAATASVTVILLPDLTITKTHTGNFHVRQPGTYTITVSNLGPGASSGTVTVRDFLPAACRSRAPRPPAGRTAAGARSSPAPVPTPSHRGPAIRSSRSSCGRPSSASARSPTSPR